MTQLLVAEWQSGSARSPLPMADVVDSLEEREAAELATEMISSATRRAGYVVVVAGTVRSDCARTLGGLDTSAAANNRPQIDTGAGFAVEIAADNADLRVAAAMHSWVARRPSLGIETRSSADPVSPVWAVE